MPSLKSSPICLATKTPTVNKPNRLTATFSEMKLICPDAIKLYGTCVANHHSAGNLDRNSCAKEFAVVKDCFRSVLKKI